MKSLTTKLMTQLTTTKMGIFNYMFNTFLTLALILASIRIPMFLIILGLLSFICLFFFMLTSILALIKII